MNPFQSLQKTYSDHGFNGTLVALKYDIVSRLLKVFRRSYLVKRVYNFKLRLSLHDHGIGRTLILFGKRELEHKLMLDLIIKSGFTILDLGANIGYYSIIESILVGPQGTVIAVEPSPTNYIQLLYNLSLNKITNTQTIPAAISTSDGIETFYLSKYSNLNTFHQDDNHGKHQYEPYPVRTLRLSSLKLFNIDLIRMDVEGHEVPILRSLVEDHEQFPRLPSIIFETHTSKYTPNNQLLPVLESLLSLGYSMNMVGTSSSLGNKQFRDQNILPLACVRSDGYDREVYLDPPPSLVYHMLSVSGGIRTIYLQAPQRA